MHSKVGEAPLSLQVRKFEWHGLLRSEVAETALESYNTVYHGGVTSRMCLIARLQL